MLLPFIGILILLVHIFLSWRMTQKLSTDIIFSARQKRLNILLTWLIPFVWVLFLDSLSEKNSGKVMTKQIRATYRNTIGQNTPGDLSLYAQKN